MSKISNLILEYPNFERLALIRFFVESYNLNNAVIDYDNDIITINHENSKILCTIPNIQTIYYKDINFKILKNDDNILIIKFIQ